MTVLDNASNAVLGEPVQSMKVTVGGGSLQSAAVSGTRKQIRWVRLFSDADCFVAWGDNPTAVIDGSDGMPLGAENPEIIGVAAGQLIAVIERV